MVVTCRPDHCATHCSGSRLNSARSSKVPLRYRTDILVGNRYLTAVMLELDAAPDLLDGSSPFVPVRDKSTEARTIAVAASARSPLPTDRSDRRQPVLLTTIAVCLLDAVCRVIGGLARQDSEIE